jgi:hypothetical protein
MLGDVARRALEALMANGHYEYHSDLARKWFSAGFEKGKADAEAEREVQGEARGRAAGKAEALLAICAARDLALTDGERARILGCADLATLDRWIRRAAGASEAAAIFD